MDIRAWYFDGRTSRRHAVTLAVNDGVAMVAGEAQRHCPLSELHVSERLRNAARKVTFPDGAYLEILDNAAFNDLLISTGHQEPPVVRLQQSPRASLVACAITVLVLVLGYLYGIPVAAKWAAQALPQQVEHSIGRETLHFLDDGILAPTQLPVERRDAIVHRFRALTPPFPDAPQYEIIFRKSKIGPNAFALPSGHIVLTDEIVELTDDEDALMGILSHELGHLHERHLMRRLIQSSVIGAAATVLFGDVSAIAANIPTVMLDLGYSRDAEREADDYAVAMLKENGIKPSSLARMFELLNERGMQAPPYLATHPPTAERITRIRSAGE